MSDETSRYRAICHLLCSPSSILNLAGTKVQMSRKRLRRLLFYVAGSLQGGLEVAHLYLPSLEELLCLCISAERARTEIDYDTAVARGWLCDVCSGGHLLMYA